jgi:simple sugar transport system permease protein
VVALPPFRANTLWIPLFVGLIAIAVGVWVLSRGARRSGWTSIGFGLVGILLGILATHASTSNLDQVVVWAALLSATLVWATPLTYAAIGGMFCERSGVVNIGLEGMMLAGAFFAALGADKFGNWEMGLVCAAIAGAGFALIHARDVDPSASRPGHQRLRDQLPRARRDRLFLHRHLRGERHAGNLPRIPDVHLGFLGSVFGQLNLMIWISFLLLIVARSHCSGRRSVCAFVPSASIRAPRTRSASRCTASGTPP